jgi:uncharacterized glyoxalase superfamily protein PhnB
MPVKPKPEHYHTVTPYLIVRGAARVIDFATNVLDAELVEKLEGPDGRIGHTELRIGDSIIMLADVPEDGQPMPGMLYVYVDNVDARYALALSKGATPVREPSDQFYGDRSGGVKDPCGNIWWFATHIEDVPNEEIRRRAQALAKGSG